MARISKAEQEATKAALLELVKQAAEAGMPKEQIATFVKADYAPLPWQMKFHAAARAADDGDGPFWIGLGGARGPGKALAINTPIPTPDGWIFMEDIKVGDYVFAANGNPTKVLGVSEIFTDHDCYEVIFSDGYKLVADADHLWVTYNKKERVAMTRLTDEFRQKRRETRPLRGTGAKPYMVDRNKNMVHVYKSIPTGSIVSTREILDTLRNGKEVNHSITVAGHLNLPEVRLPIDPYVLGAWLGDGDSARGYITSADLEIIEQIRSAGFQVDFREKTKYGYIIRELYKSLKDAGLINNKHIPTEYFRASNEQRLALLNGLMDTDGCVSKEDGSCEFTSTNCKLASGVMELALTLGAKPTITESEAYLYGRYISQKWRVRFTADFPAFILTRKLEKQNRKSTRVTKWRYITDVRKVDSVPVKCITVDDESHCYLAGERFIPTHNSHAIMAQTLLDDCQRYPGLKVLFLRKVKRSAAESMEDLTRRVLHGVQHTRTADRITLPNTSRMLHGGYNNEDDIDKYLGIEYDEIDLEEGTQISETKMTMIRGSCRSTIPGFRSRIYMSTNPGGVGHGWWKKYMIGGRDFLGSKTIFIPSTYRDNPFLAQDYRDYLEAIPGQLGRAWRDGDFDVFAGQAFPQFDASKHVVSPFQIPDNWYRWRGIDEGYTAPWCCLWAARDPDTRRIYIYREAYAKQLTIRQQAERIKDMTLENEFIGMTYADPAMWTQKNMEGIISSSADEYMRNGIPLTKADNKRIAGKRKMDGLLASKPDGLPGIIIFSNCVNLIEQLENLPVDPNRPEDVDTDAEDHCLVAGTLVTTDNGDKAIEDVVPGDFVLTRGGYKPVLKSGLTIPNAKVYEVSFSDGRKIIATANHPVYIAGGEFVRVDALQNGDLVLTRSEMLLQDYVPTVHVTGVRELEKRQPVYNLHVAEFNEFCANGVLVHNSYDAARYLLSNVEAGVSVEENKLRNKRHPAMDIAIF